MPSPFEEGPSPQAAARRTIEFGKHVTLAHIGATHMSMLNATRDGGSIHLDLSELESINASVVQLVASAAKTARRAGQVLTLTPASAEILGAFARAGLSIDPTAGHLSLI